MPSSRSQGIIVVRVTGAQSSPGGELVLSHPPPPARSSILDGGAGCTASNHLTTVATPFANSRKMSPSALSFAGRAGSTTARYPPIIYNRAPSQRPDWGGWNILAMVLSRRSTGGRYWGGRDICLCPLVLAPRAFRCVP